ncbi:MAG TPA: replication-relaxation family protein [Massilibacterium sp.]|nr:replication-relaxation family protein [Massilibacterium sp.]
MNQRHEQIMLSLDDLTYATREQLQIINNLGGERNAQRILQRMEKDKLIKAVRFEKKIYFLSNKGKQQIGSTQGELKKSWIQHTLMRNDLYISLGMPDTWKKEYPVKWGDNKLIPDATFKRNGEFVFVEIDNQQTMQTNNEKIKLYKDLFKAIFNQYVHHPTIIWYTLSEIRKDKLKEACSRAGIRFKVY